MDPAASGRGREYLALFAEAGEGSEKLGLPYEPEWSKAVYHLFVVRVADRDDLMKQLAAVGVATGIHYPIPLHLQNAYKQLGYKKGDFPVTERVSAEIVSLPMFPQLREEQQVRVVAEVLNAVAAEKVA